MADKMIDLKMSEKDRKKEYGLNTPSIDDLPKYPYWTKMKLGSEEIKKLGLSKVKGKDNLYLEADIKVKEIRFKDSGKGTEVESLTIQMQKMNICSKADANKKMRKEVEKEVYD